MVNLQKRPWGFWEKLAEGGRCGSHYWVKVLNVKPGNSISLQTHNHRSEHWFVIQGIIATKSGDLSRVLSKGHHIDISQGEIHKMENIGEVVAIVVEVALGDRLTEEDIVRYDQ